MPVESGSAWSNFLRGIELSYHWLDVRMWHSLESMILQLELRSNVDIGSLVLGSVAVFRCREDRDTASIVLDFVTLHPDFVRPDNGLETVLLAEALRHVRSKLQPNTSLAWSTARRRLWIGPEHLHHQTRLTRLALVMSVQFPDVIESDVVIREETTMEHQVFTADQRRQRQCRERLGEHLEDVLIVFSLALPFKAVHLVHVIRLVVSTVEEDTVRPQPLVGVEQKGNLCRPGTAVDKVSVEEVGMGVGGVAVESEYLQKVEELTYPGLDAQSWPRLNSRYTHHVCHRKSSTLYPLPPRSLPLSAPA